MTVTGEAGVPHQTGGDIKRPMGGPPHPGDSQSRCDTVLCVCVCVYVAISHAAWQACTMANSSDLNSKEHYEC